MKLLKAKGKEKKEKKIIENTILGNKVVINMFNVTSSTVGACVDACSDCSRIARLSFLLRMEMDCTKLLEMLNNTIDGFVRKS